MTAIYQERSEKTNSLLQKGIIILFERTEEHDADMNYKIRFTITAPLGNNIIVEEK